MNRNEIDLGHAHRALITSWHPDRDLNPQYADVPDVEAYGLIIEHDRADGTRCTGGAVTFDTPVARRLDPDGPFWQLESLDPLTISPSVLCPQCHDHGFIRSGRWQPA